jgi:hypothetical protein
MHPEGEQRDMSWKIELIQPGGLVCMTASGPLTFADIGQLRAEAMELAKSHGVHKFLSDHRNATLQLSTSDIYKLPSDLEQYGVHQKDRLAIVYSESSDRREDYQFFETVAMNRGLPVRLFADYDAALAWLNEDE